MPIQRNFVIFCGLSVSRVNNRWYSSAPLDGNASIISPFSISNARRTFDGFERSSIDAKSAVSVGCAGGAGDATALRAVESACLLLPRSTSRFSPFVVGEALDSRAFALAAL